ncbi:MAG: hypothetical protein J6R49_06570 [Clostridia bacterium]|nr:hypothetical protein [Clostridia bacterium]
MKKRIFATLIAFTLLFSAILVGCNGTEEGAQSEQTSEIEVVSLKAVFESTLKNKLTIDENGELMQFLGELENYEAPEMKDIAGVMNTKITKLQAGDIDLSAFGSFTLDGNARYDADSKRFAGDFLLDALGEKPTLAFMSDESGAYITDYLGLNDIPLFIEPEDPSSSVDEQELAKLETALNAYNEIYEHIKTVSETIIASDIEESAFTLASTDATFEGYFANVSILLTLSGEKAKAVSEKLITELMKNESIKTLLGEDFDKNELLSNADNIKELTVLNEIKNGETVGISIGINAENGEVSERYLLESTLIEDKLGLGFGTLAEDGKYANAVELVYSRDAEAKNHSIAVDVTEEGASYNTLTAYINELENKYNLNVIFSNDGKTNVNVKLSFEGDKESGKISVSDVKTTDESGKTTALPLVFNVEYKVENEVITINSVVNATLGEGVAIDAESVFVGQYQDVTIEAVTESMPIDEFDFDSAELKFALKYPKLYTTMKIYGALN